MALSILALMSPFFFLSVLPMKSSRANWLDFTGVVVFFFFFFGAWLGSLAAISLAFLVTFGSGLVEEDGGSTAMAEAGLLKRPNMFENTSCCSLLSPPFNIQFCMPSPMASPC